MCRSTASRVEAAQLHLKNHDHLAIPGQEFESLWGLEPIRGQDWEKAPINHFTLAAQCGLRMRINLGSFQSFHTCSAPVGYRYIRSPQNSFQICTHLAHLFCQPIFRASSEIYARAELANT